MPASECQAGGQTPGSPKQGFKQLPSPQLWEGAQLSRLHRLQSLGSQRVTSGAGPALVTAARTTETRFTTRSPESRVLPQRSCYFRRNHPRPVGRHHGNHATDVCQRVRLLHHQRVRQVRGADRPRPPAPLRPPPCLIPLLMFFRREVFLVWFSIWSALLFPFHTGPRRSPQMEQRQYSNGVPPARLKSEEHKRQSGQSRGSRERPISCCRQRPELLSGRT